MASVFRARVCHEEPVAAHVLVTKVLNALEDLSAVARVQNVAVAVQNAAVLDQSVVVAARIAAAQAQSVGEVDLSAAGDHDAVAVHNAAAYLHAARVLTAKVVAHNCGQGDPVVALGYQFALVQVAPVGPFPRAADFFPGVPAGQFVQADHFFRDARDDLQEFRFRLPAVWWAQLAVVALAATR